MNVYLASREYPYEGDSHLGAFASLKLAKAACQANLDKRNAEWPRKSRNLGWGDFKGGYCISDEKDYDYYSIQRLPVQGL